MSIPVVSWSKRSFKRLKLVILSIAKDTFYSIDFDDDLGQLAEKMARRIKQHVQFPPFFCYILFYILNKIIRPSYHGENLISRYLHVITIGHFSKPFSYILKKIAFAPGATVQTEQTSVQYHLMKRAFFYSGQTYLMLIGWETQTVETRQLWQNV